MAGSSLPARSSSLLVCGMTSGWCVRLANLLHQLLTMLGAWCQEVVHIVFVVVLIIINCSIITILSPTNTLLSPPSPLAPPPFLSCPWQSHKSHSLTPYVNSSLTTLPWHLYGKSPYMSLCYILPYRGKEGD